MYLTFFVTHPVSMVMDKMAAILDNIGKFIINATSLINVDIITIVTKTCSAYFVSHNW